MFGRRAVQILARGMPALLEQRVVVAASGHRLSGRNVVLVDPRPDLAHDVVDVVHVSHRRRVQPHQQRLVAARSQEVAVGVDEARQERVVTQIHHPRGRPFERHHLVHRSGGHDGFATHCDRFHGGLLRVHGDDVVTVEDRVRRIDFLSTTRENHGRDERENDEGLIRPAHDSLHDYQGLMWAAYACASRPVKPPPSPGSMPLKEQQSPPGRGGGGIRTHGTVAGTPAFRAGQFSHSCTPPDSSGTRNATPLRVWSARGLWFRMRNPAPVSEGREGSAASLFPPASRGLRTWNGGPRYGR